TRCRPEYRQSDEHGASIDDVEQEPSRPEQITKKCSVIVTMSRSRKQERHRANHTPKHHREKHSEQAAPRAARQEVLRKLAARRIAAADNHCLEGKARQEVPLENGRTHSLQTCLPIADAVEGPSDPTLKHTLKKRACGYCVQ